MGLCGNDIRIQERLIPNSKLEKINMQLACVIPSVCKILANNHIGSAFFIKLNGVNYLMTNEHVINRTFIESKKNILVYYNCERENIIINLNKSQRHIQEFTNINIDITTIEILLKDKINDNLFFIQKQII